MDGKKVLEDFEYAVRKSHGEGWDYVDGLTTEDGFKILQLLKEHEAMKVQYTAMGGLRYGACPQCDARIDNLVNPKACGFCGQELKWE